MSRRNLLFYGHSFSDVCLSRKQRMSDQINAYDAKYLLNVNTEEFYEFLYGAFSFEAPLLHTDKIEICDQGERRIQVNDYGEMITQNALYFVFAIPFDGDELLFSCQPSTYSMNPPCGDVRDNELRMEYQTTLHDEQAVKTEFRNDLSRIQTSLEVVRKDVERWNINLKKEIPILANARKEKLLKDQGVIASLGFPLRKRANMPETYTVPIARKKLVVQAQASTKAPQKPEPALDLQQYDQILKILSDMSLVMERSPQTFSEIDEESLRVTV